MAKVKTVNYVTLELDGDEIEYMSSLMDYLTQDHHNNRITEEERNFAEDVSDALDQALL